MTEAPKANCAECPHRRDLLENGRCRPGDSCVRTMSGRQIEGFFRTNPGLTEDYAGDAFWERRAIAARYLSQKRLLTLPDDPDWRIRLRLAERLPPEAIESLTWDQEEDVRTLAVNRCKRRNEVDGL